MKPVLNPVARSISLAIVLFLFWLLLSGLFTAFLVLSGLGSAIAVMWFARRMEVIDQEGHPIDLSLWAVMSYWPWLALEIVKSAWAVTRIILDPRLPISPTLTRFAPSQKTDLGLVIHANSITLTPGTISVRVAADEFLVHALTRDGAAGCTTGCEMDRRVAAMEQS